MLEAERLAEAERCKAAKAERLRVLEAERLAEIEKKRKKALDKARRKEKKALDAARKAQDAQDALEQDALLAKLEAELQRSEAAHASTSAVSSFTIDRDKTIFPSL